MSVYLTYLRVLYVHAVNGTNIAKARFLAWFDLLLIIFEGDGNRESRWESSGSCIGHAVSPGLPETASYSQVRQRVFSNLLSWLLSQKSQKLCQASFLMSVEDRS